MNKKGFLLGEETLKIVLAVIAIGFLVGFLVSLYFSYTRNKDLELAEASLEHLIEEINSGSVEVEIYNPKIWVISSFSVDEVPLPNDCVGYGWESCICICENSIGNFEEDCDTLGVCLESEFIIEEGRYNSIFIDPPLILSIDGETKKITKKET